VEFYRFKKDRMPQIFNIQFSIFNEKGPLLLSRVLEEASHPVMQ